MQVRQPWPGMSLLEKLPSYTCLPPQEGDLAFKTATVQPCSWASLAASSAPARQRDGGYMAAVYILSADKTLCDIARRKICPDGISFPGILSVARRAELSDSQFTAIRSAHNLFNGGSSSSVTPYDLALCDYLTLDIITQAMYIWKCGCTISAGQDGSIQLDRTGECQRRGIEQALFQHLSEFE